MVPALVIVVPFSAFGLLRVDGMLWFLTAGLCVLAASMALSDPWAGAMAGYAVIRWLIPPRALGLETAMLVVLGLGLMVTAQSLPKQWDRMAKAAITIAALAQVAVATGQEYLYDPLWLGFAQNPTTKLHGTLGNPMYMGTFVGIAGSVAPVVLLPLMAWGVYLSRSATAALALASGLLVRWRSQWKVSLPAAAAILSWVFWARGRDLYTWKHRLAIWMVAGREWVRFPSAVLFGFGPGAWLRAWPSVGQSRREMEVFAQAHNEYVQVGFDGGIVALALVGAWVWAHRRDLARSPWLPAAVAVAVVSVGFFPFQVPGTAVLSLMMVGVASRKGDA